MYELKQREGHLEILNLDAPKQKPIFVDFTSNAHNFRRLHGGGRGQPIAKAIGLKTYALPLSVIDATAGLGSDAFVLACLGCQVHMIERSTAIAQLLADGLKRLHASGLIPEVSKRLSLTQNQASDHLLQLAPKNYPDVIYLDPMFPEREKSGSVKKEMIMLREVVGDDQDASRLLSIALTVAKKRVVVKRSKLAPALEGPLPTTILKGKANRFDIYIP